MERWNRALDALEEQLDGEIDVAALARAALTSEYHFRRVFSALAGMPLSEYVRRRRITVATAEVLAGDSSLLDIAIRYGYGSADAFGRAFTTLHGLTPAQARRPGAVLRSQPRMSFHLRIEGSSRMKHRIVQKEAFHLVGRRTRLPVVYEGPNEGIIAFTKEVERQDGAFLRSLSDQEPRGVLSVSDAFEEGRADGSEADFRRAVASASPAPDGFDELPVPASSWVVFETEGAFPEALQQLWAESFGEWFPSNPYRLLPGPELLLVEPSAEDPSRGRGELWLAVEREG